MLIRTLRALFSVLYACARRTSNCTKFFWHKVKTSSFAFSLFKFFYFCSKLTVKEKKQVKHNKINSCVWHLSCRCHVIHFCRCHLSIQCHIQTTNIFKHFPQHDCKLSIEHTNSITHSGLVLWTGPPHLSTWFSQFEKSVCTAKAKLFCFHLPEQFQSDWRSKKAIESRRFAAVHAFPGDWKTTRITMGFICPGQNFHLCRRSCGNERLLQAAHSGAVPKQN